VQRRFFYFSFKISLEGKKDTYISNEYRVSVVIVKLFNLQFLRTNAYQNNRLMCNSMDCLKIIIKYNIILHDVSVGGVAVYL